MRLKPVVAALAWAAAASIAAQTLPALAAPRLLPNEKAVAIPSRPGITISFLVVGPAAPPSATVVIFAGGDGVIGNNNDNFLLRTRDKYVAAGLLVVSVGMPSDHKDGLTAKTRSAPEYAQDIAAVIAWIKAKNNKPIWLIGTSTGTISAANIAARPNAEGAHGLIMTSTFVPPSSSNAPPISTWVNLSAITVPTLFVHNKEDGCATSPFSNLQPFIDKLTHASKKQLIAVSGGLPPTSGPCDAMSRHGYLGLEDQVVAGIVAFIKAN